MGRGSAAHGVAAWMSVLILVACGKPVEGNPFGEPSTAGLGHTDDDEDALDDDDASGSSSSSGNDSGQTDSASTPSVPETSGGSSGGAESASVTAAAEATSGNDPAQIPFPGGETQWIGSYECPQGETALELRLTVGADGQALTGVFSFTGTLTNPDVPSGSFALTGSYAPVDGGVELHPGAWIERRYSPWQVSSSIRSVAER